MVLVFLLDHVYFRLLRALVFILFKFPFPVCVLLLVMLNLVYRLIVKLVSLQIRFCSCSRGSATPVQLPNYRASSKVCKGCGGKLLVERQGAISESMLSTVGMQLSRVIDPNLNWKVCPKGRQRALRRARTCFNVINHCKISAKSSKGVDELTNNDRPKIGHLPVSESEKVLDLCLLLTHDALVEYFGNPIYF